MSKNSFGDDLIQAMGEALAIAEGTLAPAASHRIDALPVIDRNPQAVEDALSAE